MEITYSETSRGTQRTTTFQSKDYNPYNFFAQIMEARKQQNGFGLHGKVNFTTDFLNNVLAVKPHSNQQNYHNAALYALSQVLHDNHPLKGEFEEKFAAINVGQYKGSIGTPEFEEQVLVSIQQDNNKRHFEDYEEIAQANVKAITSQIGAWLRNNRGRIDAASGAVTPSPSGAYSKWKLTLA
jgi:hypothetical protein